MIPNNTPNFSGQNLIRGILVLLVLVASPIASGQSLSEFRKQFEEFVTIDDYTSMKALVKDNKNLSFNLAALYDQVYCKAILASEAEKAAKIDNFYDQLTVVYKLEFRNDRFLMNRRKWMKSLDVTGRQSLLDFFVLWNDSYDGFSTATKKGGDELFRAVVPKLTEALQKAQSINDHYYAAHTADMLSQTHDGFMDNFGMVYWAQRSYRSAVSAGVGQLFSSVKERVDMHKSKDGRDVIRSPEIIDMSLDVEAARAKFLVDVKKASEVKVDEGVVIGVKKTGTPTKSSGGTLKPPTTKAEYEWLEEKGFKIGRPFKPDGKVRLPYLRPGIGSTNPALDPFILEMQIKKDQEDVDFPMIPGALVDYSSKLRVDPDGEQGKQLEL